MLISIHFYTERLQIRSEKRLLSVIRTWCFGPSFEVISLIERIICSCVIEQFLVGFLYICASGLNSLYEVYISKFSSIKPTLFNLNFNSNINVDLPDQILPSIAIIFLLFPCETTEELPPFMLHCSIGVVF